MGSYRTRVRSGPKTWLGNTPSVLRCGLCSPGRADGSSVEASVVELFFLFTGFLPGIPGRKRAEDGLNFHPRACPWLDSGQPGGFFHFGSSRLQFNILEFTCWPGWGLLGKTRPLCRESFMSDIYSRLK